MAYPALLLLLLLTHTSLQQCPPTPTPGENPLVISACSSLESRISEALKTTNSVFFTADITFYPTQASNGGPSPSSVISVVSTSSIDRGLVGDGGSAGIGYPASEAPGTQQPNTNPTDGASAGGSSAGGSQSPTSTQGTSSMGTATAAGASGPAATPQNDGSGTPYSIRVVLPATVATIIPVLIIALLVAFCVVKRRRKHRDTEKTGLVEEGAAAGGSAFGNSPHSSSQYQDRVPELPAAIVGQGNGLYSSYEPESSSIGGPEYGAIGTAHTTEEDYAEPARSTGITSYRGASAAGVAAATAVGAAAADRSRHNENASTSNRKLSVPQAQHSPQAASSTPVAGPSQAGTWLATRASYSESDHSNRQDGDQSSTVDTEGDRFVTPMERFTPSSNSPFATPTLDALSNQQSAFGTEAALAAAGLGAGSAAPRIETPSQQQYKDFSLGVGAYPSTSESEGEEATTPTQESTNRGSSWFAGNPLSWFGSSPASTEHPRTDTATTRNEPDEADFADSESTRPTAESSKRVTASTSAGSRSPRAAQGHTSWLAAPSPPASASHGRSTSDGSSMEPLPSSGTDPSADGVAGSAAYSQFSTQISPEANIAGSRASAQAQQVYQQFRARGGGGNRSATHSRPATAASFGNVREGVESSGADTPQTTRRITPPDYETYR